MRIYLLAFLFFLVTLLYAQDSAQIFPGALEDPTFLYHPPGRSMLLMGGTPIIQDSVQSDVWKWDGKAWSRIVASGPGARVFFKGGL